MCEDNDVTENERIARKIEIGVGDEGLRRLNASGLSNVEQKIPQNCGRCLRRLSLMQYRQKEDESLDEFVTRARTQAQMCEFEDKEMQKRIIELVIAGTKMEVFRRELLRKGPYPAGGAERRPKTRGSSTGYNATTGPK